MVKLVSACLLGIRCRYDGRTKTNNRIKELTKKEILIPVCPEQLGGLPTPRNPAEQLKDRVYTKEWLDVTEQFRNGAYAVLYLAKLYDIKEAILKQKSPSCGCGQIYDGNFTGKIINGNGVTTTLLKENGIKVISEEEL